MITRNIVTLGTIAALSLGGAALAGQIQGQIQRSGGSTSAGTTSGPAAGTHVAPSTAVQKEGRSVATGKEMRGVPDASSITAGVPGVEGKPGTQSGGAARGAPLPKK